MPQTHLSRRLALATGALLLCVAGLTESLASAATSHAVTPRGACPSSPAAAASGATPLDGVCEYLAGREGVVQVALYDKKADRFYRLSTGDQKQYTASIVKADIL